jgi:hypothetical protein
VGRPDFFLIETNSKNVTLVLPFEAHTIEVVITRSGFLKRFKLQSIGTADFESWARRNVAPLSRIAWFAYDQRRYSERMVATNLVRRLEIDLDKYVGWAFT